MAPRTATDSVGAVQELLGSCPTKDVRVAYERATEALELIVDQLDRDRRFGGSTDQVAMTNVPKLMARVAAVLQGQRPVRA